MTIQSIIRLWLPGLVLLTAIPPLIFQDPYFSGTDISSWIGDWDRFSRCISNQEIPCNKLSFFPLAYLLNSWLIDFLGNFHLSSIHAITAINSVLLSLPLLFVFSILPKEKFFSVFLIYITSILCTPLPVFYTYSGALEIQSGVVMGIFISSWILLNDEFYEEKFKPIILFMIPSGFLAACYKDTNILIMMGALALCHLQKIILPNEYQKKYSTTKPKPLHIVIIFTILLLGAASAAGYNYLRYQTLGPAAYLSIAKLTSPSIDKSLEFLLATFFSPNGGFFVFWSICLVCCVYLVRKSGFRVRPAAITTSLALVLISAFGFSLWWAPFGWDSWGDRLMIPSALASLIIIVSTAPTNTPEPQPSDRKASAKHHRRSFLTIALAAIIIPSAYYTFSAYYSDRTRLIHASLFGGKYCNEMMSAVRNNSNNLGLGVWRTDYYYNCARERFIHIPKFISPNH